MIETFEQAVRRLKENKDHIVFADMDDVDREILGKVGWSNCQILSDNSEGLYWGDLVGQHGHFYISHIYRIRPDYQPDPPKPEYIDIEIFSRCFELRCYANGRDLPISHLPSLENFRGFFFYAADQAGGDRQVDVPLEWVARRKAEGKTVFARVKKGSD